MRKFCSFDPADIRVFLCHPTLQICLYTPSHRLRNLFINSPSITARLQGMYFFPLSLNPLFSHPCNLKSSGLMQIRRKKARAKTTTSKKSPVRSGSSDPWRQPLPGNMCPLLSRPPLEVITQRTKPVNPLWSVGMLVVIDLH